DDDSILDDLLMAMVAPTEFAARGPAYRDVLGCWLTARVARLFDPGCAVDEVLVLSGPQGSGKSTWFRTVAHHKDWSATLSPTKVGKDKESKQVLDGKWVVVFEELPRTIADKDSFKAFVT